MPDMKMTLDNVFTFTQKQKEKIKNMSVKDAEAFINKIILEANNKDKILK